MFKDQINAITMYYFHRVARAKGNGPVLIRGFLCLILLIVTLSTGRILAQAVLAGKPFGERIHSSDFDTRFEAVLELSGKQDAIGLLTEVLGNDSSPTIRALAATQLG